MASGILMTVKDKVTQVGICHQFSTAGPLKKDSKLFKRQLLESGQSPVSSSAGLVSCLWIYVMKLLNSSNSFWINLISFRTFRSPLFLKPKTGQSIF